MMARLRDAWRAAPWLTAGFTLALAVTLVFGIRLVTNAVYWADPRHTDQTIAGWMTPGYVAMSWDVPRAVVGDALGLVPGQGRPPTLDRLAEARGATTADLAARIEAAIIAYRAGRQ